MTHPFQSLLDEFAYAIKHFVPTLPKEIKQETQEVLKRLQADSNADESTIRKAFHDVGVKEYPYRRAYIELTHGLAEDEMNAMVLEHVEPNVRMVIKPHLDSGVSLDELIQSDIFIEQLTPEQRYQVEDGIMVARSKLADSLKEHVSAESEEYARLVGKWKDQSIKIDKAISDLKLLASEGNENQKREIQEKADAYSEGFLITERDPELSAIQKEIEYWQEVIHPTE
ncbi:hypothetical protein HYV69_00485 [Candidatus Uhrbacteria bacterium]|nr:hypothetical protein [Candidatus Uhrbacteria bacterium]